MFVSPLAINRRNDDSQDHELGQEVVLLRSCGVAVEHMRDHTFPAAVEGAPREVVDAVVVGVDPARRTAPHPGGLCSEGSSNGDRLRALERMPAPEMIQA